MKRIVGVMLVLVLGVACSQTVQKVKPQKPWPAGQKAKTKDPQTPGQNDAYLWLEDVNSEKALNWARERNAETHKELAETSEFKKLESGILNIYDSKERIPYVGKQGPYYYNFWNDAQNPRGIWRRTTLEEYRKETPKWETILDLDALSKVENVNWVLNGVQFLRPDYKLALISLSRGGADADVNREFNMESKSFVKDGFQLPEAKGRMSWIDKNTVYVETDFGPGSMTDSGYPRITKLWKRGSPLEKAETIYEGKKTDISVGSYYDNTPGIERHFVYRSLAYYKNELFLREKDGKLKKIDVPIDAKASTYREWMLVELRTPWTVGGKTYPSGALLATRFDDFIAGKRVFTMLFKPTPTTSLAGYNWTRHHLILNVLEDVKNRLWVLTPAKGKWEKKALPGGAEFATVFMWAVDNRESDDYFMVATDFLTPNTLFYGSIGRTPEKLKQTPAYFNASGLEISQHFTVSKDGTQIPYFQVSPKDMVLDGSHPTLLTGYGGFESSEVPYYNGEIGHAWLSKGGVFVLANIRGGGEYGPRWHQAAVKENRHRAYEDYAAVARDLIKRKVTSPSKLGTMGASNGGLLVGNMLTQYPQLFGAIVCQAPLLDMKRYSHLLAGASWMAEYGNPDKPKEWKYIKTFSPYHLLKKDVKHPPVLFMSSTRDDRVQPGHARKMTARMLDMGYDVRYYENIEGGHGGAADNKQEAHMWALAYTFLWKELGK